MVEKIKDNYSFPAIFEFNKDSGECFVYFCDLPGLISGGYDYEDALENSKKGLAMHLEIMIENGETIPSPTPLDSISNDTEFVEMVTVTLDDIRKVFVDFYSSDTDKVENKLYKPLSRDRQIQVANILDIPLDMI